MKTKILTLFAATVVATNVMAYDFMSQGIYYNSLGGDSVEVTYEDSNYGKCYTGKVYIPTVVPNTNKRVVRIGEKAFSSSDVTDIIFLGNSVTSIRNYAFYSCGKLTSVTIPNSVTSIGEYAFYGCSSLTSVTIGNGVTSIGNRAFWGCSSITSFNVVEDNPNYCSIDGVLFNKDKTILIQYPRRKQGSYTIPNSVTDIGDKAFYGCTGLTSVTIGYGITSIEGGAFANCTGLNSVTIPNSVTSIGDSAFYSCKKLNSVTIPNSVTSIGYCAFYECYCLTFIEIPNSVTSIGGNAFYECKDLTSVTIPDCITSIGNYTFFHCTSLTSVTIPNSVTSIGVEAFSCCTGLTSVTMGNGVTRIGNHAFSGCESLPSIKIPNSVIIIGDYAFSSCRKLTSVTIPNSVTSIGYAAFNWCFNLTSVTIPSSVTSIEKYTFSDCSRLTSVTIGNGVRGIKDGAFSGCKCLTSVTCYATTPPSVGWQAFYNIPTDTKLFVLATSIPQYMSYQDWQQFDVQPITAKEAEVDGTKIADIGIDNVTLQWEKINGATSYVLIVNEGEEIIMQITFGADGQVANVSNCPSRKANNANQTNMGFAFTVTGLEPGTQYNYSIVAENASGATLSTETGIFTTKVLDALENTAVNRESSRKVIRDGQVLIESGDKTYTMQGQEVK